MRISLLDPGLRSRMGHHYDFDRRLARALVKLGHVVEIHGHVDADDELRSAASAGDLDIRTSFRVATYTRPKPGVSAGAASQRMVDLTTEDLSRVETTDLWFWPTLAPYQLAAAVNVARDVPQLGATWWGPRFPVAVGAEVWVRAMEQIATLRRRIAVGAYDEAVARHCDSLAQTPNLQVLPCPHDGAPAREPSESLRVIGFFGHQRHERGVELLPRLATALVQLGYHIVLQDSAGVLQQRQPHPRLRVLSFVDDLPAEMARCDLVVWPSRPESYQHQCSGIVSECIASGIPVLLPSGCLPAELTTRYGCGAYFHDGSVETILTLIEDANSKHASRVQAAREAAEKWHAVNGTNRLARWLIDHPVRRG
jgi:glycosyltransferase involved in cell wall biosynthesis